MSSQSTAHPGQVDLPRQTHVADGPHDHTGMYVMHHAFRRDLAALTAAVRATPVAEHRTWRLLAGRHARFAWALHHHHTAEDEHYWPVLRRAAGQRGTADDLAALTDNSAEHAEMDPRLDACGAAFEAMAEHPCETHRNLLAVQLATLGELLLGHMREEEHEVLPLVQRVMSAAEFAAVEAAIARSYPLKDAPFLVAWAMHELPEDGRERMFAVAGAPYRVLHALTRRRFARGEARTFRHGHAVDHTRGDGR